MAGFSRVIVHAVLALLVFASVPAGMASTTQLPLPIAQDLPVEVVLNQPELAVDLSPFYAQQDASASGVVVPDRLGKQLVANALVSDLVANHLLKEALTQISPLRDKLTDYRFGDRFLEALKARLPSEGVSPHPTVELLDAYQDRFDPKDPRQTPLRRLVIQPRYAIDYLFQTIYVQLLVTVGESEAKADGTFRSNTLFHRTYRFDFPIGTESKSELILQWQALGKDQLEQILDEGISQVTDMLVYDLSPQGRSETEHSGSSPNVVIKGWKFRGNIVRQTPQWAWVRYGKFALFGSEPLRGRLPEDRPSTGIDVPVPSRPVGASAASSITVPDARKGATVGSPASASPDSQDTTTH